MANEQSAQSISQQVEHALYKLDGLSILPAAAGEFVSGLFEMRLSPEQLCEIAESEPAVAVMLFSLLHRNGISFDRNKISIRSAVAQLPIRTIRDTFFSANIYTPSDGNSARLRTRKSFIEFAAAVAYCSGAIAEQGSIDIEPEMAYAAGLLHNIGNLALDEAMPRSFQSMIKQAREKELSICAVQRQNLNLDYTTIGKRLAQKWHLPEPVVMAVWLHQSNTEAIIKTIPQAKIAHVVRLAYLIADKAGIGTSASFYPVQIADSMLSSAGITAEQAGQIGHQAANAVAGKSKYFGTDLQTDITAYCKSLRLAAVQLASDSSKLTQQVQQSHTKSSHFDFTSEFLGALEPDAEPMEIARNFACQFRKFYQTGKVCLYLTNFQDSVGAEAIVVIDDNKSQTVHLCPPEGGALVPKEIAGSFAVADAAQNCGWIFEQLAADFDISRTKIAPLIARGNVLGAVLFEFSYPVQTAQLQEMFKATCSITAFILDMAMNRQKQQYFAERFAHLIADSSETKQDSPQQKQIQVLDILAEMAAGAAHELNNPLAVISGRAQMLSQSETDPQKKQSLIQIHANSLQLADIVNDLMSFAQPPLPRKTNVSLKQLLEEAIQLASLKTSLDYIDVQTDVPDSLADVFVDSGQLVSAVANILCNAVQSYSDQNGPVRIAAEKIPDFVCLRISDSGCGMDAETLEKTAYPFFSSKPAGRKRGMGLAHAERLIRINGGRLSIESTPDKGTTVIITLPVVNS